MIFENIGSALISMNEGTKAQLIEWLPLIYAKKDTNVSELTNAKINSTNTIDFDKSFYYNVYPGFVAIISFKNSDDISLWFQENNDSELSCWDHTFYEELFVLRYNILKFIDLKSDGYFNIVHFLSRATKNLPCPKGDSISREELEEAKKNS